jgi:flagellar protein FlaG
MSMEISGILRDGSTQEPTRTGRTGQQDQSPTRETTKLDDREIESVVRELQMVTKAFNRRLQFSINRELEQVVVKVIDAETDKVIRQLPSEEIQKLHVRIREAIGLLIDETI